MLRLIAAAVVLAGLLTTSPARSQPAQPALVQPEELEQGFVIVVDDVARMATPERPMYLASNFGGWDPAHRDFLMTQRSDGKWQIVLDKPDRTGTIQFKFTLGSWDYVETDADGNDIDNRTLPKVDAAALAGEPPVIAFEVPRFRSPGDIARGRQDTQYRDWNVTGELRRLQVSGGAGDAAGSMRDLLIWLPPGYDDAANAERRYPVLYLFDGQNLFEKTGAVPDEWHADEAAQRLIASGEVRPFVIVGVPHAGAARMQEYVAYRSVLPAEPAGEAFDAWLVGTVVPRVERAVRVTDEAAWTGIGGSSLGASIALYIGSKHPDRFGMLLLESTAPVGPEPADLALPAGGWPTRAFVGVGGNEMGDGPGHEDRSALFADRSRDLADRLGALAGPDRLRLVVVEDARHTESAWAARLPEALRFLFPPEDR
jgi:hypothetical protein